MHCPTPGLTGAAVQGVHFARSIGVLQQTSEFAPLGRNNNSRANVMIFEPSLVGSITKRTFADLEAIVVSSLGFRLCTSKITPSSSRYAQDNGIPVFLM